MFQQTYMEHWKNKITRERSFYLQTSFCLGLMLYISHSLHELMGGKMFLVSHDCMEICGEMEINVKHTLIYSVS